jgi:hypothetical protein
MQVALVDDLELARVEPLLEGSADSGFEGHGTCFRENPHKAQNFPICQFLRCGMREPIMGG